MIDGSILAKTNNVSNLRLHLSVTVSRLHSEVEMQQVLPRISSNPT